MKKQGRNNKKIYKVKAQASPAPPVDKQKRLPLKAEPLEDQRPKRAPRQIVSVHKKQMQLSIGQPTAVGSKLSVPVIAQFDAIQYTATFAAIYGFLANKNLFIEQDTSANNAFVNAASVVYMFENMLPMITGVDQKLTNAPEIAWDIISALKSKSCNFLTYGKVVYSWGNLPSNFTITINTPGGDWVPTYFDGNDQGLYNTPCIVLTGPGTASDYAQFLQKLTDTCNTDKLKVKDATFKSVLSKDVSAFARSYVYNGDYISPTGGYYKDIESEVQVTAPCVSSYGVYGTQDLRAPLKLTPFSGDGATAFGFPLHPSFGSYFNKRPPSYKLIDYEWVYYTLVEYAIALAEKSYSAGNTQTGPLFAFSQQDFRIALRQALMNVFETNYFTQFISCLRFNSSDNGFAPFQVSGGTCSSNLFSTFLVPKLIQENLAALKIRSYRNASAKGVNESAFVPVLGHYVDDTPAEFIYKGSDGATYPVFSSIPSQQPISLVNGFQAPNNYVNLNCGYYQTVKSDWNNFIGEKSAYSVPTTSIIGDAGPPGLGILFYTAVQDIKLAVPGPNVGAIAPRMAQAVRHVSNAVRSEKKEKGVVAVPPAEIVRLTTIQTTTNFNYSAQVAALYDSLITPQIRLDINSPEDQLSLQMYQCEVKEPISTAWSNMANVTGAGLASRLSKLALMCAPGIARDESSEYSQILELLSLHNNAGMLTSILGGFAKSILPPDLHGVVDVVSDLVPF